MRNWLFILILLTGCAAPNPAIRVSGDAAVVAAPARTVTLFGTNPVTLQIYSSTNLHLPYSEWPFLTNITCHFYEKVEQVEASQFFIMSATWGTNVFWFNSITE